MWFFIVVGSLLLILLHAVYFSGRLVRALAAVLPGPPRRLGWLRGGYLVLACSVPVVGIGYRLFARLTGSSARQPESELFDALLVYPFWVLTIWSVQCTLLVLPIDMVHAGLRKLGRFTHERWLRRKELIVSSIAAVLLVYVPVSIVSSTTSLEVHHHDYASADVPPALDGFRIVLIGDLQADRYTGPARLEQLVSAVNAQEPDLVLIAGDLITRGSDHIEVAARYAGKLRARHGVWACVGDHDNFAYGGDRGRSVREVSAALAREGVHMLDNEVRTVTVGDGSLAVILATNNYIARLDPGRTRDLLEEAGPADVRVLLAHQTDPALLAAARAGGVHLFLGGHTHGGQVRFWLPLLDLAPVRFETPYVQGAYQLGDMLLVVTSGLGVSMAPVRYRTPAAIDVIDLTAR